MTRIKWQLENPERGWNGKIGERVTFWLRPDGETWKLVFTWTNGVFDGFPNITAAREAAERKLVLFAEETGITLPEDVEEEQTLAEELVDRIQGEMRWFKDSDTDEARAGYVATQVLDFFTDWVKEHRELVDSLGGGIENLAVQSKLAEMEELLLDAQKDLGVEVEREGS